MAPARTTLAALTDWLVVLVVGALVYTGRMPWEPGLAVLAAIAGLASVFRGRGHPQGVVFLLMSPKALWAALGAYKGLS